MERIVPYGIRLGERGEVETVPIVHAEVRSRNGKAIPAIFIVDSGARTSLLSSAEAEALGLDPRAGDRVLVHGVTGEAFTAYRHLVTCSIEGILLRAVPILFAEQTDVPAVMGREGIFPRFAILFDEARRRVGFFDRRERKAINRLLS